MENQRNLPYAKEIIDYLMNKNSQFSQSQENYLESMQKGKLSKAQRENVITWISEICDSQNASKKTMQLSIYYLDSFLSQKAVSNFSILELIGLVCISIALKYEESREFPPMKILALSQNRFTLEAVIATEVYVLSILNWKIDFLTPDEILQYLFEFTCENFETQKITKCAQNFIQIALTDYEISRFSPFVIAVASAICVFQIVNYEDFCKDWLRILESEISICVNTCSSVSRMIKEKLEL
jgi:hypothetical protein